MVDRGLLWEWRAEGLGQGERVAVKRLVMGEYTRRLGQLGQLG